MKYPTPATATPPSAAYSAVFDFGGGGGVDSVEYLRKEERMDDRAAKRGAELKAARLAGILRAASIDIFDNERVFERGRSESER